MTSFIALYRGQTVADAKLIAVSADVSIVADVLSRLLTKENANEQDKAGKALENGRRSALEIIQRELQDARKNK